MRGENPGTLRRPAASAASGRSLGAEAIFAVLPLLLLPVAAYNLLALLSGGLRSEGAAARVGRELAAFPLPSGAQWSISTADVLVFASLAIFFIELVRSTTSHRAAIVNHTLAVVLFVGCLGEFLLARAFATSAFFLITVMTFLDVTAGFLATLSDPRFAG